MARFQPKKPGTEQGNWRDMRDAKGKLCARIDTKRMVLEIRRSDRDLVATFDLRDYLAVLRVHTNYEA